MHLANNKLSTLKNYWFQELLPLFDKRQVELDFIYACGVWLGLSKLQVKMSDDHVLTESEMLRFLYGIKDLKKHRPIQYITGKSYFYGLELTVREGVLIPRPETEELVDWVLQETKDNVSILDVGTGSGCIPLSLKSKLRSARVFGMDVSQDALKIATKNAQELALQVEWIQQDILNDQSWSGKLDVIVSNPPYIPSKEKSEMASNVLLHEPGLALFVPDNDPLIFYRNIAQFTLKHLVDGGSLFFEIHEELGEETLGLLKGLGFVDLQLKNDLQGKNRMIKASLP